MMDNELKSHEKPTWWKVNRPKIWTFMNNPHSSVFANMFGFLSLFIVLLSIFSFVADTTVGFAVYARVPVQIIMGNDTELDSKNSSIAVSSTTTTTSIINTTAATSDDAELFRIKHPSLQLIDTICLVFFTVEYILHLLFSPNKLKYSTSIMGVIDVVAILPDYLELIVFAVQPDLVYDTAARNVIAVFHLARVLRIFRLIRHVPGLWIFIYTFKASIGELVLLGCFMLLGILLFSSLIYYAEDRENIESIPHAFWWAIITMTTVGYGDMYPVTIAGKLIGSTCAMSGLLMIGFSVPALVNNFMLFYKHVQYAIQAEREMEKEERTLNCSSSAKSKNDTLQNGVQNGMPTIETNGNESTEMTPLADSHDLSGIQSV